MARERIPGSTDNDVTGVNKCSQQRGNLKDDGYNDFALKEKNIWKRSNGLTLRKSTCGLAQLFQ
ncbi:hypothetical protein [Photorhabdus sp. RW14-46]|uniref:hypothetical protein n=1 Tax=Photorhabdus sp. RW14-46 TaxID=2100168 RepID=UPI0013F4A4FE|nr:hypothetical protein [Photorhabdus sp. RW14-46]